MAHTTRRHPRHHTHSREAYVQAWVQRAVLQAVSWGILWEPLTHQERRALFQSWMDAYTQAMAAWKQSGFRGDPPTKPWRAPKTHRVEVNDATLDRLIDRETAKANKIWNKMTRDGGPRATSNWDFSSKVPRKAQRRHFNQACSAMVRDPERFDDGAWQMLLGMSETFPNPW
jgi:hypothetical protein